MSTYFDSYVDSHAIDPSGLVTKAVSALAVGSGVGLVGYAMQSLMPGILGLLTALVFVWREYVRRDEQKRQLRADLRDTKMDLEHLKARMRRKGIPLHDTDPDTEDY